jgi:predicted phage baseplate assembly protein
VENRRPALGGYDGETIEEAMLRGPMVLRSRDRAVTAEDYENLAWRVAPQMRRIKCFPVPDSPGAVRVLLVADAAPDELGRLPFAALGPRPETLAAVAEYLDERRVLGARISVEPPAFQGVTVVAVVRADAKASADVVRERALHRLFEYLNPLTGGPDRKGWPFGRPLTTGEIFGVLQGVKDVDIVDDVKLFGADPVTGERGGSVKRIDVSADTLVFSYDHQIRVIRD